MAKINGDKGSGIWQIILIYIFSRFILELIGMLSLFYFPSARALFHMKDLAYHQQQPASIEMWARWDSEWYLLISEKGYSSYDSFRDAANGRYLPQETAKFFPAYPLAIRGLTLVTRNSVLSGLLLANIAAMLFLYFFYHLGMKLFDDESAFRASLFYIFFPTSLFLTAVYSESFFLAALAASFYFVEQRRLIPALFSAAILMLTRPQGALALPFLVWLGFQRFEKDRIKAAGALLFVALVALASYFWYIQRTFGSFQWILESQNYWRGEMKYPFYGLVRFAQSNIAIHGQHNSIIDFGFAVFQILILFLSIRKLPAPYWLFSLVVIAIPLSSSTFSFSRLCLANFPFFLYLGHRLTGRLAFMAEMAFALLLSFFTAAFANWYWVG
jgi:Gpi18-like mannosyltransferase